MLAHVMLVAVLLAGCAERQPRPAPVCLAPATPAREETPPPAPVLAAPAPTAETPNERFYPGADDARTERRRRYATAVLLFAPPRTEPLDALVEVETLSLEPVVCAIDGKLRAGMSCGEAMPRKVTVRLTGASGSSRHEAMEILRSTRPFTSNPDDGPVTFPAPYAPSCCSYKQCNGRTIPYRPATTFTTTKTLLAVWPADADIDLQPRTAETDDTKAHGWSLKRMGPRALLEIATSDIDHDGRPESIVYETWANDYGLDVLVQGTTSPIFAFSCGNI